MQDLQGLPVPEDPPVNGALPGPKVSAVNRDRWGLRGKMAQLRWLVGCVSEGRKKSHTMR